MEIVVLPEEERSAEIRTLGMLPAPFPACFVWDMLSIPLNLLYLMIFLPALIAALWHLLSLQRIAVYPPLQVILSIPSAARR